ncbi:MAG: polysaccharide deacetylase family protein [Desulfomonile tiedjei]|nr:polysaccharide deacetylase family protein [Desulfomonile tiedjei]
MDSPNHLRGASPRQPLTVVMYHYVRDLEKSRYPAIKGLPLVAFREQLGYLESFYRFVTLDHVLAALDGLAELPPNSVILTFDDGYADHYENVFPILREKGIQGWFFPPGKAVMEKRVLDVNKIHFILASGATLEVIIDGLFELLEVHRKFEALPENKLYYDRLALPSRFDSAEVVFVKRMLQRELPRALRETVTNSLFRSFVTNDEHAFAKELYMSTDQLRTMVDQGMYIGSHGYDHIWLNTVPERQLAEELDRSLRFLLLVGARIQRFAFCYPYGAHSDTLLRLLRKNDCALAFTTEVAVADLSRHDPLLLPRLDTNDLPKSSTAGACQWTNAVCAGR